MVRWCWKRSSARAGPRTSWYRPWGSGRALLFERLSAAEQARDPLLSAAQALNDQRSRSPAHGDDLRGWTDGFFASARSRGVGRRTRRLRHAACLLADIAWRAHPDYRSEQALSSIANGTFAAVDHPGRAYLALAVTYRHVGSDAEINPQLRSLLSPRLLDRARILGGRDAGRVSGIGRDGGRLAADVAQGRPIEARPHPAAGSRRSRERALHGAASATRQADRPGGGAPDRLEHDAQKKSATGSLGDIMLHLIGDDGVYAFSSIRAQGDCAGSHAS